MTGKLVSQVLLGKDPEVDLSEVQYGRELDPVIPGHIVHW
jgi:hypothetical protein